MKRYELENKIFIGVVEDNEDPKKLGRLKIRVVNVFDDIPTDDIPWSKPWKDLNGNSFILPERGKVVSVVFEGGNPYKPEYIFAEHYNRNLEEKLKSLSGNNYTSMRAIMFDHKTQIYSNDDEGLKLDYKFNNININESNINLNLKDNQGKISLGDEEADQQMILGTNFMKWFDEFVENIIGSKGGPYLSSSPSAPVVAHPQLVEVMAKYKALRDPKFLSDNVYVNSNYKISAVSKDESRKNDNSFGDDIKTTTGPTKKTYDVSGDFTPKIDPNNEANILNDPEDVTPKTKPVYLEENSPQSGIISEFADEMVKISKTQIGIFENPINSNSGPEVQGLYQRSTWLTGTGWAWCGAFICYLFKKASEKPGILYSFTLPKTAGAYDFENWARNNNKYVDLIKDTTKILPGDIIIFNFSHIGISISQVSNGSVTCIEGNTDDRGSREGGGVYKKHRRTSLIKSVIRLKYNPNLVVTKTKVK